MIKSFLNRLKQARDNITQGAFNALGYAASGFCQIETVLDDSTFVLNDGGLLTMLRVSGMRAMPGEDDAKRVHRMMEKYLSTAFARGDHTITFIFERSPDRTKDDLMRAAEPTYATARRLNLSIDDVIDSDIEELDNYCVSETSIIVVATHPRSLSKEDLKDAIKERLVRLSSNGLPIINQAQNPLKAISELVHMHHTLISMIAPDLNVNSEGGSGFLSIERMTIVDASRYIRSCIDEEFTAPNWRPAVPGGWHDTPRRGNSKKRKALVPNARIADSPFGDESHLFPPLLGTQFVPRDLHIGGKNGRTVRVGERYFSPMVFDAGPQTPEDFILLFREVGYAIPWRLSITLTPRGLDQTPMRLAKIYTSIFGFMGETNRRLRDALNGLGSMEQDGETIIGFQATAMTWAPDEKTLNKNLTILARSIQTWGTCEVTDAIGDPAHGFFANIPGFCDRLPAPIAAAPLSDVLGMLPLLRPASPWVSGSVIYRTPDGKPYPIQPVSPLMNTWNLLIYAPPGSGKSVTMNTENFAICLSPGLTRLPLMVIMDIGPSSSGLISMLEDALPHHEKHLVGYFKLQNTRECTINMFSTQLGCRFPTPRERGMQINFLTLLATPVGSIEPYEMAGELAGALVDEMYKLYSDKQRPKLYQEHVEKIVDNALRDIGFVTNEKTTWWQVVDALFLEGKITESLRAQDYAMPTLSDVMTILGDQIMIDLFARNIDSAVKVSNGQLLVDAMATVISSALREYPILNGVTRFNTGAARVISLDLNEVAVGEDPVSKRRTAIMYFLGYSFIAKNFFIDENLTRFCDERYRAYHAKRVMDNKEEVKSIVMDEFHKTGGLMALRQEIVTNMREGRKWNVRVVLASQMLDDFNEEMTKLMSALYIMKSPDQKDVDRAQHLFNLSDIAARRVSLELNGPTSAGAPFLAIYQTKKGRYSQILVNTIGPKKNWALSTTAEDMGLRNRLQAVFGGKKTREILSYFYPGGSAMTDIMNRRKGLDENAKEGVVETLAMELLEEGRRLQNRMT